MDLITFSQIRNRFCISYANFIWIHSLTRKLTLNSLPVMRINYGFVFFRANLLWDHDQLRKFIVKGSPEGSSDHEFRSSILCDMIEISWWLISRSIENLLKMTSPNFRVGSACLRDWIQKCNGLPSELPLILVILNSM